MANLGQECGYFIAGTLEIRYDDLSLSSPLSRIFVRFGLILVRCLLWAKAVVIRGARLLAAIFRPIGKLALSVFFVPVYRAGFASRRQIVHWYRPAKNRLMFFVTNRAVMHLAIAGVVLGTVAINLGMDTVRAETLDAFNKSLAYAVITQEQSPVVEEYADMDPVALRGDAASYLSYGSLAAPLGAIDGQQSELSSSATSLIGGGSLAVPIIADASASVAPRESVETYTVADGDTISTIAARFGISVNTVLWANNLTLHSVLKLGQSLTILPTSGLMHTVKKGDTLSKIAKMYGADSAAILAANTLADEGAIAAGQKLVIPGGTPVAVVPVRPSAASVHSVFVATPSSAGTKAASSSARMLWPSDGHYIVRGLSWFHTGVDIDCDGHGDGTSTQDNYAAAAGTVTFAGWNGGGYGYFVIIDHGNGLKTRYGHNHSLYVKAGQQVSAGTPIGRCGSTGNSTGTHLHFEVVGGNGSRDFRNPLEYIR
jgi:murein DD-endopeptidase MepM/ murein hydrolase activator NlpD